MGPISADFEARRRMPMKAAISNWNDRSCLSVLLDRAFEGW